jgi:hypothetical protein
MPWSKLHIIPYRSFFGHLRSVSWRWLSFFKNKYFVSLSLSRSLFLSYPISSGPKFSLSLSLIIVVPLLWSFQYLSLIQLFCFLQIPRNSMEAPSKLVGGTVQSFYISIINKCLVEEISFLKYFHCDFVLTLTLFGLQEILNLFLLKKN